MRLPHEGPVTASPSGRTVVSVNQDSGIDRAKRKGAAIHLAAMRDAFTTLGRQVVALDESDEARLCQALREAHSRTRLELIYERYALGRSLAAEFASTSSVPFTLEVNAPLATESRHWRGVAETEEDRIRDRVTFESASCVIAVSSQVADYAVERGAHAERVHVFANGVSTLAFQPRKAGDSLRQTVVPKGRVALGFHGRLRPWHGFERLVAVCRDLIEGGAPIHLVVVGEGDFGRHLNGAIPESRRTLVGWKPNSEVGAYVAAFDVLPLTYDPAEPFYFSPLKLMEAMACAVVPVVPNLGDLGKIVEHEVHGIVYRADDLSELTHAIERLIQNPELLRALGKRAAARASIHSWERIARFVLCEAAKVER